MVRLLPLNAFFGWPPQGAPAQLVVQAWSRAALSPATKCSWGCNPLLHHDRRPGPGANRRTAKWVGGGAALGTLIGAIAGGGKGAAIGAAVGAAGGATTQVLTKGSEVKVPAETMLTFQLDQPLRLEAAQ